MYSDRKSIEPYPFDGTFFVNEESETESLLDEGVVTKKIILETKCDVQDANKIFNSGAIAANYNVYFPFDKEEGINITIGMEFECKAFGLNVSGTVVGVFPSQMGGCVAYVKKVGA